MCLIMEISYLNNTSTIGCCYINVVKSMYVGSLKRVYNGSLLYLPKKAEWVVLRLHMQQAHPAGLPELFFFKFWKKSIYGLL